MLAVGWLFFVWRRNVAVRTGFWAVALATLAISIPVTWHTMDTPTYLLTDDQQGFSVMLLSGHPELVVDRIDKGDGCWKRVLTRPGRYPNVRCVLISQPRKRPNCQELVREDYPDALEGKASCLRLTYETPDFALFRIAGLVPWYRGAPS